MDFLSRPAVSTVELSERFTLLILDINSARQPGTVIWIVQRHAQIGQHSRIAYTPVRLSPRRPRRRSIRLHKPRRRRANLPGHFAIIFRALDRTTIADAIHTRPILD